MNWRCKMTELLGMFFLIFNTTLLVLHVTRISGVRESIRTFGIIMHTIGLMGSIIWIGSQ